MSLNNDTPLYLQISDDIQVQIINGTLLADEKLPTEKHYMDLYSVSRVTVRKAMDELEERGLIEKRKNKGCYVRKNSSSDSPPLKTSVYTILEDRGIQVSSKILKMELIEPDESLRKELNCKSDEKVIEILRLRLGNDKPFAVQKIWLAEKRFPDFNPWKLCNDSLRRIMVEDYHCSLSHSEESISARMPDSEIAELLNISESTPIIFITSRVYSSENILEEYSETYYDTREYAYSVSQNN